MNKRDILVFSALWIFFGSLCVIAPLLPDADWLNYHHYNCWAFLNDRLSVDFLASNSRICINPIVDLPIYFLMNLLNNHPKLFLFVSSIDTVGLFFVLYKILDFVIEKSHEVAKKSSIIFLSMLYLIAPVILIGLDFSRNDTIIAFFLLVAFYLFLKYYFDAKNGVKKRFFMLFLCGIFSGLAIGLKLSVVSFVLGLGLLFLIFFKKSQSGVKDLTLWVSGVVTAFLAFDGWWLIKCYSLFKNPLFPYYNHIFKSPFADAVNFSGNDYWLSYPKNFFEFVFYPFIKSNYFTYFFENHGVDYRFPIAFVCTIFLIVWLKKDKSEIIQNIIKREYLISILTVVSVSYVLNLVLFGSPARYIISSFMFYGIILYVVGLCLSKYFQNSEKFFKIFVLLSMTVFFFQKFGELDFVHCYSPEKNEKLVLRQPSLGFEDNSVVMFASICTSFLAVSQNQNVQYSRFQIPSDVYDKYKNSQKNIDVYFFSRYFPSKYSEKYCQDLISSDKKLYIVFYEDDFLMLTLDALDKYNLQRKIPRKLKNCKQPDGYILGSWWGFGGNYICEFN